MYPKTENYIDIINSSSNYFFHMNHSVYKNKFEKNKKGLLSDEYPVTKNLNFE